MRGANVHKIGKIVLVWGLGRQGKRGVGGQYAVDAVFSLGRQSGRVSGENGTRAFARLGVGHLSQWLLDSLDRNKLGRNKGIS